ncbi:alpha/beta hydrolase [uncultured Lactobacillus sp.]|uniref:alpha/beta hydrolase n=1 Tax=uncultured Lactobacillus sp. TaxID=153152 RepID=UPI00261F0E34|nr:alpha/beta hydrolase [uncultured Lactobacillus sp.]
MWHKHRKLWISLITILTVTIVAFLSAGMYFFNVACVPGHKSFLSSNSKVIKKSDPLYQQKIWYQKAPKQNIKMRSSDNKYILDANYIAYPHSKKTVVILHGYMNTKDTMGPYSAMFHSLGYNVLMPDARAHGASQGKYIGYGWVEKSDVKKWLSLLAKKNPNDKIVIFGVSMGAATAMMTAGEKIPHQVKAVVEDCGYSNVKDEIEHEAQDIYNMPAFPRFPMVEILSVINRIKVGYFLKDGSSVNQLKKNKLPTLFIHGQKDTFVPTKMVYENYRANHSKKSLWIVKGAGHAKSFQTNPVDYQKHVDKFLHKYVH